MTGPAHRGRPPATDPFHHEYLPQRAGRVELLGRNRAAQVEDRAQIVRGGRADPAEMEGEIDLGGHPAGPAQAEPALRHPLAEPGDLPDRLLHPAPQRTGLGRPVENGQGHDRGAQAGIAPDRPQRGIRGVHDLARDGRAKRHRPRQIRHGHQSSRPRPVGPGSHVTPGPVTGGAGITLRRGGSSGRRWLTGTRYGRASRALGPRFRIGARRMVTVAGGTPRIGLVLGGGGIAGYSFHAGALAALETVTGWDPRTAEIIVGTSAGASVAAVIRGNVPVTELVRRILSVPDDPRGMARLRAISGRGQPKVDRRPVQPASPRLVLRELGRGPRGRPLHILAGLAPPGRLATTVLGEQAENLHPHGWPARTMWIPAVDLDSGHLVVFGRDPIDIDVPTAVAASCAIPAFFRPVTVNGARYVDGGVRSIMNAELVADLPLDLVVALAPLSLDRFDLRSPIASALRGLPHWQLRHEIGRLRDAGIPTLVLEPDHTVSRAMGPNPMDPNRMVPVLVDTTRALTVRLSAPGFRHHLDLLVEAAACLESPPDVGYPD